MVRDWLVSADDRTGAFEVAALLASAGAPVRVDVGEVGDGPAVVDLGSRAATAHRAAELMRSVPASTWRAHKIDSTLRGNWLSEVGELHGRVLVAPAWPAMGRTCVHGVVHVHGEALASVPAALDAAGLTYDLLADPMTDPAPLERWLAGQGPVAVVDAASTTSIDAIAGAVARHEVVVVGPAGPIGAAFRSRHGGGPAEPLPVVDGPRVVVCASASPVAREQVARVRSLLPVVEVIDTALPDGPLHPGAARELAVVARSSMRDAGLVVLVGGDTAAAVLGDAPRWVGGFAAPGMPWSLDQHHLGPVVVSKAGAFGDADTLVRLLSRETE
ncbi:MAG: hypothetical protein RLZ14_430 [Actinomycetota bacterium]